jgi:hypothetical protein
VNAVGARLQTISVVNGYHTALGAHVFQWLPRTADFSELPWASIRDMEDAISIRDNKYHTHELAIDVDIASTSVDATRQAIYDVYKSIGVDPTLGGLAIDTRILGDQFEVDQKERKVAGAVVSIAVDFRTTQFQES